MSKVGCEHLGGDRPTQSKPKVEISRTKMNFGVYGNETGACTCDDMSTNLSVSKEPVTAVGLYRPNVKSLQKDYIGCACDPSCICE